MIFGKFLGDKIVKTTSTTHLRSYASYSPDKKQLFVYLINKADKAVQVQLTLVNHRLSSVNQVWELAGKGPKDKNPIWRRITGPDRNGKMDISGTSIMVVEYGLG